MKPARAIFASDVKVKAVAHDGNTQIGESEVNEEQVIELPINDMKLWSPDTAHFVRAHDFDDG